MIVAFCFYNMSSILNGLVYYDQFGSLSALHLGLVFLGLCILLGGVWAVSVTSGNGGVEPGTWQEGAEDVDEVVIVEEARSYLEHPRRRSVTSTNTDEAESSRVPHSAPGTLTLTSPVSVMGWRKSGSVIRKQRYPSLLGVGVSDGASGTIGGLSIGLSATSPGFALKPTKRRVSGQGGTLFVAAHQMGMRRAVSEAEVGRSGESARARARWKWLRNVLAANDEE